jgi:hypothetical protein
MNEVKNRSEGSPEMLEIEQIVQQTYYPQLYGILPIMLEGTDENITSPNAAKYVGGFLQLAGEFEIAQMRMSGYHPINVEKRKCNLILIKGVYVLIWVTIFLPKDQFFEDNCLVFAPRPPNLIIYIL